MTKKEGRRNRAGQGEGCRRADARQRRQRRPVSFWPPNFTDFQVRRLYRSHGERSGKGDGQAALDLFWQWDI